MNQFSTMVPLKALFAGFLIITLNRCEVIEPVSNPDYTGQTGQVTDIEGNIYNTIGIGSQIWMKENLKTTKFTDNSAILYILNDSVWSHLGSPGYCWYNNDSTINKKIYGALYNFYVIETGLICPTGWHVPAESDWNTLESFLGGREIAGGKLKDYYTHYWSEPNLCLENNYSFSALPGGERLNFSGRFSGRGDSGNWWTSSPENNIQAFSRSVSHESRQLYRHLTMKSRGKSIRCIKD